MGSALSSSLRKPGRAWPHATAHRLWRLAVLRTLVASISEDIRLLPVQQTVGFDHIVDVARCAAHGVHQTGISVHADVRLHAEEPLLALLALVHLRVSFTAGVLGRARCGDQRGIDHCAAAQHQPWHPAAN